MDSNITTQFAADEEVVRAIHQRMISWLTSKSSDQEIIRWTESHDVFDRLEQGVSEVVEDHSD